MPVVKHGTTLTSSAIHLNAEVPTVTSNMDYDDNVAATEASAIHMEGYYVET